MRYFLTALILFALSPFAAAQIHLAEEKVTSPVLCEAWVDVPAGGESSVKWSSGPDLKIRVSKDTKHIAFGALPGPRIAKLIAEIQTDQVVTFPEFVPGPNYPPKGDDKTDFTVVPRTVRIPGKTVTHELEFPIDEGKPPVQPPPATPPPATPPGTPPDKPPILTDKATAATYVYEQRDGAPPVGVQVGLNRLNRERNVIATLIDDDILDGTGQVPDQYKAPLAAAKQSGIPALVVTAGEKILRVVNKPTTEQQVLEAVP